MSYILDALKRAEHERASGPATGSGSAYTGGRDAGLHPATMILAGATLFLAGIGVAALLLKPAATKPPQAAAGDVQPPTAVQAIPPTPASAPEQVIAEPPEQTEPAPPSAAEPLALNDYAGFDDITPVFQGAGVAEGPESVATAAAPEIPQPAPEAGAAATASPATATLHPGAPRLNDMPADFRARFPRIQLQVHVHDAEPAKRWIMIDGRRYAEGSALSQGPRIVEILPDGVVFEFSGQRVHWPLAR